MVVSYHDLVICALMINDEDLNIWEQLEANKLPVGEHKVHVLMT